jgi:iron-sulfur cluster assembly accessory protein
MEQDLHLHDPAPVDPTDFQLHLTDVAAKTAAAMMERQGLHNGALRVNVSGGGCSGMQYSIAFDDRQRADDLVIEQGGVQIFVDRQSAAYLNGVTIDYVNALSGAGFKFLNPNASRTCGCGSSFSV